jgi:hypothetical protein
MGVPGKFQIPEGDKYQEYYRLGKLDLAAAMDEVLEAAAKIKIKQEKVSVVVPQE